MSSLLRTPRQFVSKSGTLTGSYPVLPVPTQIFVRIRDRCPETPDRCLACVRRSENHDVAKWYKWSMADSLEARNDAEFGAPGSLLRSDALASRHRILAAASALGGDRRVT